MDIRLKNIKPIINNQKLTQNKSSNTLNFLHNIPCDTISFKGKKVYSLNDIKIARESFNQTEQEWVRDYYTQKYKEFCSNRDPVECNYHGSVVHADMNKMSDRIMLGIFTLGLNEIEVQLENMGFRTDARRCVDSIKLIRADLKNAKIIEETAQGIKDKAIEQNKIDRIKAINIVKEDEIAEKIINPIQRQKEGKDTEIPNTVMLSNSDNDINKELIQWTGENINGNFIVANGLDYNLDEVLEEAEENYKKTKDWNLIYVKDMDELLNKKYSDFSVIESMKSIMTDCAEYYHSTLIFAAPEIDELDDIALSPHRVKRIDTSKILTPQKAYEKDARERLKDKTYPQKTPISAINDLLTISGADKSQMLDFYSQPKNLNTAENFIKNNTSITDKKNFETIFNEAKNNFWYCVDFDDKQEHKLISTGFVPEFTKNKGNSNKGLSRVIGMENLKNEIRNDVIRPLQDKRYKEFGIDIINGFLFYGPPGCGKTFVIKALADELKRHYVEITPSNVGSTYKDETLLNIKDKFDEAKRCSPSVVFIDEIEALAPSRSLLGGNDTANEINKQVNELLMQFNNCKDKDILIVCASNEPQKIDAALKRTGRLDKKIFVPNPDIETRTAMIKANIDKVPSNKKLNINIDEIARQTDYYTAEDIKLLLREAKIKAADKNDILKNEYIMESIKNFKPSLTKEMVELYKNKGNE